MQSLLTKVDTMTMDTQKATSLYDLPHEIQLAAGLICVCGRGAASEIHQADTVVEQATHRPPLVTEHGS